MLRSIISTICSPFCRHNILECRHNVGGFSWPFLVPTTVSCCASGKRLLDPYRRGVASSYAVRTRIPCLLSQKDPTSTNFTSARPSVPFVLEAAELTALHERAGLDLETYLISVVESIPKLAVVPISDFPVTAIGVGVTGRAYVGVNLEFHGLPLSNSVHAEQFMVANAIQHGETSLKLIVVSHAPCGHCRQFLQELRFAGDIRIVIADKSRAAQTLHEWLPHRFGPHDLLSDDFPLLMEPRHHGLQLADSQRADNQRVCGSENVREQANGLPADNCPSAQTSEVEQVLGMPDSAGNLNLDVLAEAAISAANTSYSPYSNSPSGLAIRTRQGTVYAGSYLESAAYNPSLPPLQNAIIAMISNGSHYVYSDIREVVLAELREAPVQYSDTTKMILDKIAPKASFVTVHLAMKSTC